MKAADPRRPGRLLGVGILGAVAAVVLLLSPSPGQAEEEKPVRWVTFRCQPSDAEVWLEVAGLTPYRLGPCDQRIPLDVSLFDGQRSLRLIFRRSGWHDAVRSLQQAPTPCRYFVTRDRYPEEPDAPVRLIPGTDLPSRWIQLQVALGSRWSVVAAIGLVGAAAAGCWLDRRRRAGRDSAAGHPPASPNSQDPFSGLVLGGYRLLEPLGAGGMATVYRALPDDTLDPAGTVAVKVLPPELGSCEEFRKRFCREAGLCGEISHAHIVRLIDWGEQEGLFYLVMEFLEGETLRQMLPSQGFPSPRALDYVLPVMMALGYAHGRGIVHRDVKPENVFVTRAGQVKLMDFGVARADHATVATATGVVMGTPAYMAPEQIDGEADPRSDQYSVGILLYELLTGRPPYQSRDPVQLAFMHAARVPPPPSTLRAGIPQEVEAVVLRMLEKAPPQRYPTMVEAARALKEAAATLTT